MAVVSMKDLLEAGVHFGHQTTKWNPKMAPFIYTQRKGIHIIDLQKTVKQIDTAYEFVVKTVNNGGVILFVGTKKQAQSIIETEAKRCGMPYVTNRWLGGMFTNFITIKNSIERLKRLEKLISDENASKFTKKELNRLNKQKQNLEKNLGGIRDMYKLPDAIFLIDPKKEEIPVAEAKKLELPIIAVIDTDGDPEGITYPIVGNDDAIRTISLFTTTIANAVLEGKKGQILQKEEAKETEEVSEIKDFEETLDKVDENQILYKIGDYDDLGMFETSKEDKK